MMRHILIIGLCLSLSACVSSSGDGDGNGNNNNNNNTTTDTVAANDTASPADASFTTDSAQPVEDTGPAPDTATPPADTSMPPQAAGLLCPAIFNCVNTEMQKICPPTGATQACQNQAISTCAGMADTPQEAQWFQASLDCQITCLQQNGGYNAGAFECMRSTCVKAQADCYSAGVYGAGGCADIDSCSQGCQLDSTFSCVRACFQGSTEQASLDYHDINLCAQASCVDSINTPQFEPCAQAAVGQGGACSAEVAICIGANTP